MKSKAVGLPRASRGGHVCSDGMNLVLVGLHSNLLNQHKVNGLLPVFERDSHGRRRWGVLFKGTRNTSGRSRGLLPSPLRLLFCLPAPKP